MPSELVSALTWIHHAAGSRELLTTIRQIAVDTENGNPPLLRTLFDGKIMLAASYFRILHGHVATLGGVRAVSGHESRCGQMLESLVAELGTLGIQQIQAVVDENDAASIGVLRRSGFGQFTSVQQFVIDVQLASNARCSDDQISWVPASQRSRHELSQLIESTFLDTLDCPALNQLRTPQSVLSGFLEGAELADVQNWYVLHRGGRDVGCVFTAQHSSAVVELIYMGLDPNVRGQRLGTVLVHKAIQAARELGAKILVAGVDRDNQPALRIYQDLAFQRLHTLPVFFRNADIQRMRLVA